MKTEFRLEKQKEERQRLGLLNLVETAHKIGVSHANLFWHLRTGKIPAPSAVLGRRPRKYYLQCDIETLKEYFDSRA